MQAKYPEKAHLFTDAAKFDQKGCSYMPSSIVFMCVWSLHQIFMPGEETVKWISAVWIKKWSRVHK